MGCPFVELSGQGFKRHPLHATDMQGVEELIRVIDLPIAWAVTGLGNARPPGYEFAPPSNCSAFHPAASGTPFCPKTCGYRPLARDRIFRLLRSAQAARKAGCAEDLCRHMQIYCPMSDQIGRPGSPPTRIDVQWFHGDQIGCDDRAICPYGCLRGERINVAGSWTTKFSQCSKSYVVCG